MGDADLPFVVQLASQSPRRADILSQLKIPYVVISSTCDESKLMADSSRSPEQVVQQLARCKADSAERAMDVAGPVLAGDTVVALGSKILGKPHSPSEARDMLAALSGSEHQVLTGICWVDDQLGATRSAVHSSVVWVDELSDDEIEAYVSMGESLDAAGAYKIQGGFARHIREIRGDFYSIAGLPANLVYRWWRDTLRDHD